MTTFQVLIESFLKALSTILPWSSSIPDALTRNTLEWSLPIEAIELITLMTASLALLVFFRFDWLGILSAGITSISRPMSLKSESRTLDQHILVFLLIVGIPLILISKSLTSWVHDPEALPWPLVTGGGLFLVAIGLLASSRWNKRIRGLNHLRLIDAVLVGSLALLSAIPGIPLLALLWIGFAFSNYHYEAIAKYSALLLGISVFARTLEAIQTLSLKDAFSEVGALNSLAVVVVGFTVIWIGIETVQKSLSEESFKNYKWLSLASGIFLVTLHFMGKF